jgi:diadenosine tetraphosphatase ApaH/serine/threonine PP2A family protein phosphatase
MHEPKLFNLSGTGKAGDFVPTPGVAIPVPPHRQWLVIPGSAGQPRDGNPAACYAMLDEAAATLTFHRVPYDHESAGVKIRAANLPQRLASRLEDGH